MIEPLVAAAHLPQTNPDHAAAIGQAEGRATLALLRALGDGDWTRSTDCTEWTCEPWSPISSPSARTASALARCCAGSWWADAANPGRTAVDAHMAVGVGDHRKASGPELVERFALLWPRAVRARRHRPGLLRRVKVNSGTPGLPRWAVAYLLDAIYNRDLWTHRVDLARATGRPLVSVPWERPR